MMCPENVTSVASLNRNSLRGSGNLTEMRMCRGFCMALSLVFWSEIRGYGWKSRMSEEMVHSISFCDNLRFFCNNKSNLKEVVVFVRNYKGFDAALKFYINAF